MNGRMPSGYGLRRDLWWSGGRLIAILVVLSALLTVGARVQGAAEEAAGGAEPPRVTQESVAQRSDASLSSSTAKGSSLDSSGTLFAALRNGGPMLIPIVACSFVLVVFIFERLISLRRGRVIPRPFVRRFLHQLREGQLDAEKALELCDANDSPIADVFAAAAKKWGRPAVEVEQAILDAGERVTNQLRKYLRLFNGIYTVTPLFGLLGTVLGMISSFRSVATGDAMGRAELLAGGISQALISTAAGLSVAIPALVAYLFFLGRLDSLVMEIDLLAEQVANGVASDGWKEKRRVRVKAAARAKAA